MACRFLLVERHVLDQWMLKSSPKTTDDLDSLTVSMSFMTDMSVMGAWQSRENESKAAASLLASAEFSHLREGWHRGQCVALGFGKQILLPMLPQATVGHSDSTCPTSPLGYVDLGVYSASYQPCSLYLLPYYGYGEPSSDTSWISSVGCL